MYCKKCKYNSFDHVSSCPKCGVDWEEARKALYLSWIKTDAYQWLGSSTSSAGSTSAAQPDFFVPPTPEVQQPMTPPQDQELVMSDDLSLDTGPDLIPDLSFSEPQEPPVMEVASELEVPNLPDLDFTPQEEPPMPEPAMSAEALDLGELHLELDKPLDAQDTEEVLELDLDVDFDSLESQPQRDNLFIPELEEMLSPWSQSSDSESEVHDLDLSGDGEIVLDFGLEVPGAPAEPQLEDEAEEVPLIDLDFSEEKP